MELDGNHFEDFNSLFDYIEKIAVVAIDEFEQLFEKYPKEQWKFDCLDHMGTGILRGMLNED